MFFRKIYDHNNSTEFFFGNDRFTVEVLSAVDGAESATLVFDSYDLGGSTAISEEQFAYEPVHMDLTSFAGEAVRCGRLVSNPLLYGTRPIVCCIPILLKLPPWILLSQDRTEFCKRGRTEVRYKPHGRFYHLMKKLP